MSCKLFGILISGVLAISLLLPSCSGRPQYDQDSQLKFPQEDEQEQYSTGNEQPGISSIDGDVEGDNEILKDLPPNVDLNNLTPEQKAAFDELVALAEEEDSQVQGRTFGLVKHKFAYLWNKFASLFSPHKFFEFEYNPHGVYGQDGGNYKRVQDNYLPGPSAIRIPIHPLFGGITRFFANVGGNGNQYDSHHPHPYGGPIRTHEEDPFE